ncbi:hypothetical protein VTK56DRAFT_8047 [Thermocarpiscus australiensis]
MTGTLHPGYEEDPSGSFSEGAHPVSLHTLVHTANMPDGAPLRACHTSLATKGAPITANHSSEAAVRGTSCTGRRRYPLGVFETGIFSHACRRAPDNLEILRAPSNRNPDGLHCMERPAPVPSVQVYLLVPVSSFKPSNSALAVLESCIQLSSGA